MPIDPASVEERLFRSELCGSIVAGEHDQGSLTQTKLVEFFDELPRLLVKAGDIVLIAVFRFLPAVWSVNARAGLAIKPQVTPPTAGTYPAAFSRVAVVGWAFASRLETALKVP